MFRAQPRTELSKFINAYKSASSRRSSRSNQSIHWNPGREKVLNIAYRFRIYPTEEQKILLGKTFGCCRFLYNQMLDDKIREYEKTKKMLKNTPAMYKREYPFLKEVDSLALEMSSFIWKRHIRIFFGIPRLDFQDSSQNIILETAIQRMWSMEISWWKVRRSDFRN